RHATLLAPSARRHVIGTTERYAGDHSEPVHSPARPRLRGGTFLASVTFAAVPSDGGQGRNIPHASLSGHRMLAGRARGCAGGRHAGRSWWRPRCGEEGV